MFHQICGRPSMCIILLFSIMVLLIHVVIRDQSGQVRRTFSLQARRINVVVIQDDHSRTTGNQTSDNTGPVQVGHEESNGTGNQTIISDVIRDGLFDIFTQRHMIGEGNSGIDLGNEYEEDESDAENVIVEDNSPSYLNTVKTEETSSDDGEK